MAGSKHAFRTAGKEFGRRTAASGCTGRVGACAVPFVFQGTAAAGSGRGYTIQGEWRAGILGAGGGSGDILRSDCAGMFARADGPVRGGSGGGKGEGRMRHSERVIGGEDSNEDGVELVLRDAHRYADELRERDRLGQRRGW